MGRHSRLALALSGIALAACGDGDPVTDCADAASRCGEPEAQSLLGDGATTYPEGQDSANGSAAGAESTRYVLETEHGLAIEGSFEAALPTADQYVFNSGELGAAGEPGFPGVDIQIVIGGEVLDTEGGVSLNLDTVQEFGYSSLSGSSYFMNAALRRGTDYVLRVTPAASLAGESYTIEIRGHRVER